MSKKKKFGLGLALTGIAAGIGAVTVAMLKKKKREEIYHEAELKAMNELDELMSESEDDDNCCADCSCSNDCCANDEPDDESEDEIYEQVATDEDVNDEVIPDEDNESKPQD